MRDFDWGLVNDRLIPFKESYNLPNESNALTALFLNLMFEFGNEDTISAITDGFDDCGIDAAFIVGNNQIHIVQTKYSSTAASSRKNFPRKNLGEIPAFLDRIFSNNIESNNGVNQKLYQKSRDIKEAFRHPNVSLTVWLCSNGEYLTEAHLNWVNDQFSRYNFITVKEFGIVDFITSFSKTVQKNTTHNVQLLDEGVIEHRFGNVGGIVGSINAKTLYEILSRQAQLKKIDTTLFAANIRGFLGLGNPINKQIFQSASAKDNYKFWYYNNGITIVGTDISYPSRVTGPCVSVSDLQIVNGAQTCSALFQAYQEVPEQVSGLSILVRIFEAKETELSEKISVTTNSQNRIYPRDLMANDSYQMLIEEGLKAHDIKYIRKRQHGILESDGNTLDALKAGQIILAYFLQEPDKSKRASDKIFGEYYNDIFNKNITAEKLAIAFEIYKRIEFQRESIEEELRLQKLKPVKNDFLLYGSYHVLFLVGFMQDSKILNDKALDNAINEAVKVIASVIKSSRNTAYYQFFRDPKTTLRLVHEISQHELNFESNSD